MGGIDKTIFCSIDQELYKYNKSQKKIRKLIIKLMKKHQSHKTLDAQKLLHKLYNLISPTKQKHSWLALKDPSSMLFLVQGWTFHHPHVVALQLFATASNDDMHRGARWRPESLGFGGPVVGGTVGWQPENPAKLTSWYWQLIPLFTGFQWV